MTARIAPGRVHLIVGPSGAGKDTLIERARAALRGGPAIVFARRVVTRAPDQWEDYDSLDPATFARALDDGAIALAWQAHGLRYGLPRSIDDHVVADRRIVCNGSRDAVLPARARWAKVRVVYVEAPLAVRAARLAWRGREIDLARLRGFAAKYRVLRFFRRPKYLISGKWRYRLSL